VSGQPNDNEFVRRLLALVMLVMFASLNAVDGVEPPPLSHHLDAPSDPVEHPPRT